MLKNGLATADEIKEIERSVLDEVEDSVDFADKSPKPVGGCCCCPFSPFVCPSFLFKPRPLSRVG